MHHKNHHNSTSNHNSPQHQKNPYPSAPAPAPQSEGKRSALSRLRERFQEKPATEAEVKQLGLDAKREYYKTLKYKAKSTRPGRFDGLVGGGQRRQPAYRKSSRLNQDSGASWLFGGGGQSQGGGWLTDNGSSGPSFSMFGGGPSQKQGRGKQQRSGIEELF